MEHDKLDDGLIYQPGVVFHNGPACETVDPADAAPPDVVVDGSSSVGVDLAYAREDHAHNLTTYASTVTAVGDGAAAAGTATTAPSRGDHKHSLADHDHSGDTGDGGTIAHASIASVGTDDHHAKDHASRHIDPAEDQIDGDQLDVDFTPSNYTPDMSPAEAADVDDLAAHLKGIDSELGTVSGAIVTDHGALSGLSDDDHTQYLNETRHDALPADNPHSVTHSQLGGVGANDHHAQAHALDGSDHTATTNITTHNATSAKHGLCPKLSGTATEYLDGSGAFTTPPGLPATPTWASVLYHDTSTAQWLQGSTTASQYKVLQVTSTTGTGTIGFDWVRLHA